ncbi:hypothetical protein CC2G_004867 [Coprinopsis cinerea AmutBmut pab1-1]|nr:hypothetical protein CC2G_004867 [Coprinopsis cinerea AmutBmut pab1-1]
MQEPAFSLSSHRDAHPTPLNSLHRTAGPIADHVEQIASTEGLKALSLADRAFTHSARSASSNSCHSQENQYPLKKQLANAYELLSHKPSLINFVQSIQLSLLWHTDGSWLFNNGTFTRIILLLSQSANPPSRLCIDGMQNYGSQHPDMLVGKMIRTFFASSLVVLHLFHCTDVPPPILLVCPNLKELTLRRKLNTRITEDDPSRSLNVDELRIVLDAIPLPNQLTTLDLDIGVYGASPFHSTRSQDWRGLMKAIRRLSQPIDVGTRSLSSLSSPSGSSSSSSSSKVKLTFNFSFSAQSTPGFHISQSQHEDLVEFVRGDSG